MYIFAGDIIPIEPPIVISVNISLYVSPKEGFAPLTVFASYSIDREEAYAEKKAHRYSGSAGFTKETLTRNIFETGERQYGFLNPGTYPIRIEKTYGEITAVAERIISVFDEEKHTADDEEENEGKGNHERIDIPPDVGYNPPLIVPVLPVLF